MSLIKRIVGVFKAKANKAVEMAEKSDPIGIAKSELREAQEDLAKFESAMKLASAQKLLLEKSIKAKQTAQADWLEKAKIAKEQENLSLAEQCCEKSVSFGEEAETLKASLASQESRYNANLTKFRNKQNEINALKSKIKDAEIRFKTARSINELEESQTSGAGVKSVDRINDMLDIVEEETALADASLELNTTDDERLEAEVSKLTSGKKAKKLLDNL